MTRLSNEEQGLRAENCTVDSKFGSAIQNRAESGKSRSTETNSSVESWQTKLIRINCATWSNLAHHLHCVGLPIKPNTSSSIQ